MIVTRRRGLNAGADFQHCVCKYVRQTKHHYLCGCNSVGRVSGCQSDCRGFESHHPLHLKGSETFQKNKQGCSREETIAV